MSETTARVETLLARHSALPDIWGEGALFAFSGLDGPNRAVDGLVASLTGNRFGLLLHTPQRALLEIELPSPARLRVITGDVLVVESKAGPLVLTFGAWHTLIGMSPPGATVRLRSEGAAAPSEETILRMPNSPNGLRLHRADDRFALTYGHLDEADQRIAQALQADILATVEHHLAFFAGAPSLPDPQRDRMLKKCFSVMKVNAMSEEGPFQQRWSTPDRVPHRDCWLWDSVFHSLAMNHLQPQVAWDYLKSVFDTQQPDGLIPHQTAPDGRISSITQPPLLAWGVWENYRALHDRNALQYAFPILQRYLAWNLKHRDRNHNGLLEWFIEGDEKCRSGESGMDNSPRFDDAILLDAVDFSTFQAEDLRYLGLIARELNRPDEARVAEEQAARVRRAIHEQLWDEEAGLYVDRDFEGRRSKIQAVSGFLPLLLEDIPPEHVRRLVQTRNDAQRFGTAFPLPSVALNDPSFGTDMWRGPTWINLNYFIALGFRRCGCSDEADRLRETTIAHVARYYEQAGCTFEYYDATDRRPPWECDRKGPRKPPYNIRRKFDAIRDYHWTAALTACFLLEAHAAHV